jgi:hypothetical protein
MARKAQQTELFSIDEGLVAVRAGEAIVLNIGALDRQSGVVEILALCRSRENRDLAASGRWGPADPAPQDNYYPIRITIPSHSPTVVWELARILLRDGQGNSRSYHAGRDFDEFHFQVQGIEGIDSTPPRLLGIRMDRA